jgi:mycothione reductase
MKEYDLLVVGTGSGMSIAAKALEQGMKVAVVDKDDTGGTCLNRGCIPSKVLLYPADVVQVIREAQALGINASIESIDFNKMMERMWKIVLEGRHEMELGIKEAENLDYYQEQGAFVSDYTMKVGAELIKADKICLVSGGRSTVPPIKGIEDIDYLDNTNVFDLKEAPKDLIILGGGFIALEFAHFFSSIGTRVTIIGRNVRLLPHTEPEISQLIKEKMSLRMDIFTGLEAQSVERTPDGIKVSARNKETGDVKEVTAGQILLAVGRTSNADLLDVAKTGVDTDGKGWIKVNEYLETSKKNIWSFGDATGQYMFKHVANYETQLCWNNAFGEKKVPVDFHAVPYAVFCHPQIASVGMTEAEAKEEHEILVGINYFRDTAKGYAMNEKDGFCKAIVEAGTNKILGFHIIGPEASILIQEVVNAMNVMDGRLDSLYYGMHIHPALSEVVLWTFGRLGHPHHHHE